MLFALSRVRHDVHMPLPRLAIWWDEQERSVAYVRVHTLHTWSASWSVRETCENKCPSHSRSLTRTLRTGAAPWNAQRAWNGEFIGSLVGRTRVVAVRRVGSKCVSLLVTCYVHFSPKRVLCRVCWFHPCLCPLLGERHPCACSALL